MGCRHRFDPDWLRHHLAPEESYSFAILGDLAPLITLGRCWRVYFQLPKDRGRIPVNPCECGGRLYAVDRTDKVWGEAELAKLFAVASKDMATAVILALWTGQRLGDLLRLTWSAYDGKHIRLRQSKTGRAIVIPVGFGLKEILDRTPKRSTMILTNRYGVPWTSDGLVAR